MLIYSSYDDNDNCVKFNYNNSSVYDGDNNYQIKYKFQFMKEAPSIKDNVSTKEDTIVFP